MLDTVRRAFRIEEIRKKIFYTFLMLIVVRFGSQLPAPGVDPTFIQNFFANQTGDAFNFFDAFTGGSFTQMSVFALQYYAVHHIIYYHAASDDRDSETGRYAERGCGWKKEDCGDHKICDGRSCIDRVYCNGSRIRTSGTSR